MAKKGFAGQLFAQWQDKKKPLQKPTNQTRDDPGNKTQKPAKPPMDKTQTEDEKLKLQKESDLETMVSKPRGPGQMIKPMPAGGGGGGTFKPKNPGIAYGERPPGTGPKGTPKNVFTTDTAGSVVRSTGYLPPRPSKGTPLPLSREERNALLAADPMAKATTRPLPPNYDNRNAIPKAEDVGWEKPDRSVWPTKDDSPPEEEGENAPPRDPNERSKSNVTIAVGVGIALLAGVGLVLFAAS